MTDYSDLIKRLRERSGEYDSHNWHSDIEFEAADYIEELEKRIVLQDEQQTKDLCLDAEVINTLSSRIKDLERALKPFAEDAALNTDRADDAYPGCSKHKVRDLRRALELLEGKE
jgi:hypothetical protein